MDYRVRSPRLQAKLCISGRRPRAEAREDTDFSGSDVDDMGPTDSSLLDASLASLHLATGTSGGAGDGPGEPSTPTSPSTHCHASSKSVRVTSLDCYLSQTIFV